MLGFQSDGILDEFGAIEDYAFADCYNHIDVRLPNTLRWIGDLAFSGYRNIMGNRSIVNDRKHK